MVLEFSLGLSSPGPVASTDAWPALVLNLRVYNPRHVSDVTFFSTASHPILGGS